MYSYAVTICRFINQPAHPILQSLLVGPPGAAETGRQAAVPVEPGRCLIILAFSCPHIRKFREKVRSDPYLKKKRKKERKSFFFSLIKKETK